MDTNQSENLEQKSSENANSENTGVPIQGQNAENSNQENTEKSDSEQQRSASDYWPSPSSPSGVGQQSEAPYAVNPSSPGAIATSMINNRSGHGAISWIEDEAANLINALHSVVHIIGPVALQVAERKILEALLHVTHVANNPSVGDKQIPEKVAGE